MGTGQGSGLRAAHHRQDRERPADRRRHTVRSRHGAESPAQAAHHVGRSDPPRGWRGRNRAANAWPGRRSRAMPGPDPVAAGLQSLRREPRGAVGPLSLSRATGRPAGVDAAIRPLGPARRGPLLDARDARRMGLAGKRRWRGDRRLPVARSARPGRSAPRLGPGKPCRIRQRLPRLPIRPRP
jgi:hypothetical protein